ncbi:hypothetical protein CYY_001374 [Polysphondylium violaceum]|uniref:Methylated-DNA--protein-cysteine methyltransferase n=1 Tax=Polysphondylium violaceum TaxID=133409 RepID=A0A8J4V481_9MYCE|nr:hypothetical protein CYY_001374 [Polysphondylium violaceum]
MTTKRKLNTHTTNQSKKNKKEIEQDQEQLEEGEDENQYWDRLETPIGVLGFYASKDLLENVIVEDKSTAEPKPNTITNQFKDELNLYFKGKLIDFKTPFNYEQGTEFQQMVWRELMKIPYGQTQSYKQIATSLNKKNYSRAVASACRLNKFSIIVPCHRVVSSSGKVIGYFGKNGIDKQHQLYALEQKSLKKE